MAVHMAARISCSESTGGTGSSPLHAGRWPVLPSSNSWFDDQAASWEEILQVAPLISICRLTSSKMKNSGSGPKRRCRRYRWSWWPRRAGQQSGVAIVALHGHGLHHVAAQDDRGVVGKGSSTEVLSSGISTMSESLMPFQPEMDEPSNILPPSKTLLYFLDGMVTCCSLPRVSVKRRSTQRASFFYQVQSLL